MLKKNEVVDVLGIYWRKVRLFTVQEIELVQNFCEGDLGASSLSDNQRVYFTNQHLFMPLTKVPGNARPDTGSLRGWYFIARRGGRTVR